MIIRAVSSQDVQPLAAVADADVMPLPNQEPAAVEQVQAPDRMAGIHEVATRRGPRLTPVPPIRAHELTLLLPVRLPGPHLLGIVEDPRGDLLPELLDLGRSEPTGVAPVV